MKIGIIGVGVVGGTYLKYFRERGFTVETYDKSVDPPEALSRLRNCDYLYLCVPTPHCPSEGTDLGAIKEVAAQLSADGCMVPILVKSTLLPGMTENLANTYRLSLVSSPEFLSSRTAYRDLCQQKQILLGFIGSADAEFRVRVASFHELAFPGVPISPCSATEAELAKIACNCFYAVKVQYFNEVHAACRAAGCEFSHVRQLMLNNGWIAPEHTVVPGPDGKFSYGGACLPKDAKAFLTWQNLRGLSAKVLEGAVEEREQIRPE
ncbi:MAG: Rossmann-fold NAD(P)-binding domain-containing protein [Sulfobacillus sp.]